MLRIALGMLGLTQIRHVKPVRRGTARGPVAEVYRQLERDFGVIGPPVALHAPAPEPLAAAWTMVRETLVAQGNAPQAMREAVATAVSRANECPYCVAIHDDATRAHGGGTLPTDIPPALLPELGGVAVMMHYLNRMVNVFLRPLPLPPAVPAFMLRPVMRVLGPVMRAAPARNPQPGTSLDLLPDAPLPPEFWWAKPSPTIAAAFSRASQAINQAGHRAASPSIHRLLSFQLGTWKGQPPGLSRQWADDAVTTLPAHERPAAKLALLTAFASYQVDDTVIASVRHSGMDDRTLIELCSWSSFSAARRIATWIPDHILATRPTAA